MERRQPDLNEIIFLLQQNWPAKIVVRSEIGKLTGGLINPKTLANEDSQGIGISPRLRLLRRVAYRIEDVAKYLLRKGLMIETIAAKKKNDDDSNS